jgi:hypothetical protein
LVVVADDDLVTRRSVIARATLPKLPVGTGYATLGRNTLTYKVPFVASDGRLYIQSVKIEAAFHPEYEQASKESVIQDAPAFLVDSDFTSFWHDSLLA